MATTARIDTKPTAPTLGDYWAFELRPAGYRRAVPDPIDVEYANKSYCACGQEGLECHGYRNQVTGSYRAFWVCPICGGCEEV